MASIATRTKNGFYSCPMSRRRPRNRDGHHRARTTGKRLNPIARPFRSAALDSSTQGRRFSGRQPRRSAAILGGWSDSADLSTPKCQFNPFPANFAFRRSWSNAPVPFERRSPNHPHSRRPCSSKYPCAGEQGHWEVGGWYPEYCEFVKGSAWSCEGSWEYLGCIAGTYLLE
jgi:hypothetical protein